LKIRCTLLLAAALLASGLATGCSGEAPVYSDPAQPINVRLNREFIVSTPTNPGTGYQWRGTYDKDRLKLVASTFETSRAADGEEEKVVLEQHFRFQALAKGETAVQLDLMGPDMSHSWRNKVFPVTVR
jgi:predicted secreted protein